MSNKYEPCEDSAFSSITEYLQPSNQAEAVLILKPLAHAHAISTNLPTVPKSTQRDSFFNPPQEQIYEPNHPHSSSPNSLSGSI